MTLTISYDDRFTFERRLQLFIERQLAIDPSITIQLDPLKEVFEQCIRQLFADNPRVIRASVDLVQGGDAGRSPRLLFKLISYQAEDLLHMVEVAHFGTARAIRDQAERWGSFCTAISDYSAQRKQVAEHPAGYGIITWTFLRGRAAPRRPLQTLLDLLRDPAQIRRNRATERGAAALRRLFADSLSGRAPAPRDDAGGGTGWHDDSREHPGSIPLHFYNRVLPPVLTLREVRWSAANAEGAFELAPATIGAVELDPSPLQPGARVAIPCGPAGFTLRADPRKAGRILLLPGGYDPGQEAQPRPPLRPLLARVIVDAAPSPLPSDGLLIGTVVSTRAAELRQAYARIRRHLPGEQGHGLSYGGRLFRDPIELYPEILAQPITMRTSIIHGDLNLSNILIDLVDADTEEESLQPMLIDFEWTESGGHTAFDLVKLEVEYRTKVMPGVVEQVEQLLLLEQALFQGLRGDSASLRALLAEVQRDQQIAQAYSFIKAIRDLAFGLRLTPAEYYAGLLGYSLAALKWPELSAAPDHGAGPYLPPAVLAYVCAACAAGYIPEAQELAPPAALPDLTPYQDDDDLLVIGRRPLIERIVADLSVNIRPVVWLKSVALNGLEAAGARVIAGMRARGRRCLGTADRSPTGLLDLLHALLAELGPEQRQGFLHSLQPHLKRPAFQALRAAAPEISVAALPRGMPTRYRADEVCRALVRALEQSGHSWLVTIHLGEASDELVDLAGRLRLAARGQVALLLLDDRDHAQISPRPERGLREYSLPVWGEAEVRRYLERRGLGGEPGLAGELLAAGHRLPDLIHALVGELVEQSPEQIARAVGAARAAQSALYLSDWVARLGPTAGRLLAFEWLLGNYTRLAPLGPTVAAEERPRIERGRQQQLVEEFARSRQIPAGGEEIQAYLRLLLRDTPGVVQALQHTAYLQLHGQGGELQEMSAWLAERLRADPESAGDGFVIAQYLLLAGEPEKALAQVFAQRHEPEQLFSTTRCLRLSDLLAALAKHTRGQPYPEREILILAGSYELHIGNLTRAAEYYQHGTIGPHRTPRDGQISQIKLWQIYDAFEHTRQYKELESLCAQLLGDPALSGPMRDLVVGLQIYAGFMAGEGDPEQAHRGMREITAALARSLPAWPVEQRPFLYQQFILLQDLAARMRFEEDDFVGARELLEQLLPQIAPEAEQARPLLPRYLSARISSNLGLVLFTNPAGPYDLRRARSYLEEALKIRDDLGDRLGQQRTGLNLANYLLDLAPDAAGWREARQLFDRYLPLARGDVETAETVRLKGSLIELLIRQGDFQAAAPLLPRLDPANRSSGHLFGHTVHARLAIWRGDLGEASRYLLAHHRLFFGPEQADGEAEVAEDGDRRGWLQNSYELIWMARLIAPQWRPEPALRRIIADTRLPEPGQSGQGPVISAEIACAGGLRALALALCAPDAAPREQFELAAGQLARARAGWGAFGYRYLAALAGLWQLAGLAWAGQPAAAADLAATLEYELRPFGETTPAWRLLQLTRR